MLSPPRWPDRSRSRSYVAVDGGRDGERDAPLPRRLFAEALGTGFLTFVAAGTAIDAALHPDQVDGVAKAFVPGLLIMAMIYSAGDVSGAHFNPVVSLAFALRRVFPWRCVPLYWLAQLSGAIAAAALLRALFGTIAHDGTTPLHVSIARGVTIEVVLTWLLVTVILNTATRHHVVGAEAAIAVGATIVLCGLFAGPFTGASMNPARSMAPAIVSGDTRHIWLYVVGPIIGALLAVATAWLLHPHRNLGEVDAAGGESRGAR